jgi:hypothetical protein
VSQFERIEPEEGIMLIRMFCDAVIAQFKFLNAPLSAMVSFLDKETEFGCSLDLSAPMDGDAAWPTTSPKFSIVRVNIVLRNGLMKYVLMDPNATINFRKNVFLTLKEWVYSRALQWWEVKDHVLDCLTDICQAVTEGQRVLYGDTAADRIEMSEVFGSKFWYCDSVLEVDNSKRAVHAQANVVMSRALLEANFRSTRSFAEFVLELTGVRGNGKDVSFSIFHYVLKGAQNF